MPRNVGRMIRAGLEGMSFATLRHGSLAALRIARLVCVILLAIGSARAQDRQPDSPLALDTYARPGLVEMPTARTLARDDLTYALTAFQNTIRHAASFQLTDRIGLGLRYNLSYFPDASGRSFGREDNFDRSLGLSFRLRDESQTWPALTVGINDILGTGRFESEYLVATKRVAPDVDVTAGLGWGRMASAGGFANPLARIIPAAAERERLVENNTIGEFNAIQWFRGDVAVFGGVSWQATDSVRLAVEYSGDAYPLEDGRAFTVRSPMNLGLNYRLSDRATMAATWLYGATLGTQFTYTLNPSQPRAPSGWEPAGPPVRPRAAAMSGVPDDAMLAAVRAQTARGFDRQGLGLHGLTVTGSVARVEIENGQWPFAAQALGRAARVLSGTLSRNIVQLDLVLIEAGLPVSVTTIRRDDLEAFEYAEGPRDPLLHRSRRADPGPGIRPRDLRYPRLDTQVSPYLAPSFFDPDSPLRLGAGVDLAARWEAAPGLTFGAVVRQPLFGNLDTATRASTSVLPRVRSESYLYDRASPALRRLTAGYNVRPGRNLYARIQAGLLEQAFGGVAAEALWYLADSRLALGLEVARVRQRETDQRFAFRDHVVTTGHVSAYWDIGAGFHAQVDLGRYLAGDVGATVTLARRFENGWQLAAFTTLTDVPFATFGEGSFDKGLRLTVPVSWMTGRPTRDRADVTLRPVLRDGGARLDLEGRLYDTVYDATAIEVADGWGRFWR